MSTQDTADARGMQALGSAGQPIRRPALIGELLVVGVLIFLYDRICGLAQAHPVLAVHNGSQLLDAEHRVGVDLELSANLWLAAHGDLAWIAGWYYQLAHLTVTLLVLLAIYWFRPNVYRAARNALVAINAVALIIFWTYPVAPPRLLPGVGYVDIALDAGTTVSSATSAPDQYAAMPSLHTAWAVWVAVVGVVVSQRWWARLLAAVYPGVTVVVIVATGNHYLLDAVAGAAIAVIAFAAAVAVGSTGGPLTVGEAAYPVRLLDRTLGRTVDLRQRTQGGNRHHDG